MEGFGVLHELYLIVVALYLLECVRWVGRSSVMLRSFVPGRWHFVAPWQLASQWKRALALSAPWPPLGALHVIDGLPVYLGPNGITLGGRVEGGWCRPGASAVHVPWAEVDRLRFEELELQLDKKTVLSLGTRRMAAALQRLFAELKDASPQRRERVLEKLLAQRMDLEEVRKRRRRWRGAATAHLVMNNVLLVVLFGAAWLILFTPWSAAWRLILTGAVIVWALASMAYDLAAARALPAPAQPTLGRKLATLISPMSLVRSADEIRAELYGDLDALAVAAVYLPRAALHALGRRRLAELAFPILPPEGLAGELALSDEAWLRGRLQAQSARLLAAHGAEPEALLRPGFAPDPGCATWCPRCLSQYTQASGQCANCPGVPLQPFAQPAALERAA